MQLQELILTTTLFSTILTSAAAQGTGRPRSAGTTARIGGVNIETPKGEASLPVKGLDGYQLGPGDQVTIPRRRSE